MSLSIPITTASPDYASAVVGWQSFASQLLVTPVTKEVPHPAQSGYTYARLVRQHLFINKLNIIDLGDAVSRLGKRPGGGGNLLLVDDLVGSGEQCIELCKRKSEVPGIGPRSLADLSLGPRPPKVYYRPIFATEYGINRIHSECPWVNVEPVHRLDGRSSAIGSISKVWQDGRFATAQHFLQKASARAGIDRATVLGFHDLGLLLTFEYGPPDATLGIIMHKSISWNPLIHRA